MQKIEDVALVFQPDDPEHDCKKCYQYDSGHCHFYDLATKPGYRCGLFAEPSIRNQKVLTK